MTALQPRFFEIRSLYESREEPPKMFHWSIFIITIVVTEILTNIMCGTLFFLPWYFAVGFWQSMTNPAARGAYQWAMFVCHSLPFRSNSLTLVGHVRDVGLLIWSTPRSSGSQCPNSNAPYPNDLRLCGIILRGAPAFVAAP
jgi:hypothetical protein